MFEFVKYVGRVCGVWERGVGLEQERVSLVIEEII